MGKSAKATSNFVGVKDHVSQLPDEILITILSKLTLEEAGRTSILSRRWRYLWTFFSGKMNFEAHKWSPDSIKYVRRINKILKLHRGVNIEEFRLIFKSQVPPRAKDINKWIKLVAKKRVEKFLLRFPILCGPSYDIPSRFMTNRLSFESLKALRLDDIEVNDGVMEFFLSKSPNLESLEMGGSLRISKISVPSSSVKLEFLCLYHCKNLREITISARSLRMFVYHGPVTNIVVKDNVNCLVTFVGGGHRATLSEEITHLCRNLPLFQLENLILDLSLTASYVVDENEMEHFGLPKVKDLQLQIRPCDGDEILNCLHLLEAAPILYTLTIKFDWLYLKEVRKGFQHVVFDRSRIRHVRSLKVVEILEFRGLPAADGLLVKTLLETYVVESSSLDKLTLSPYRLCEIDSRDRALNKQVEDNIALLLDKGILPAGTHLKEAPQHLYMG